VKQHQVELANQSKIGLKAFLQWLRENLLKERPELFIQNGTLYVFLRTVDDGARAYLAV
jgi:hypothetical protein